MTLAHTPLPAESLSAEVQRALAGPMKKMAARGLAPLSDPADLATVLYQLAVGEDADARAEAERSAVQLPAGVLRGALASERTDPRVLDFIAQRVLPARVAGDEEREELLGAMVQNPRVSPESVADLARQGSAELVDLIAENQSRLLQNPAIIAAMYTNPRARMSTVDRAVELAVREGVKVRAIPAWDEIAQSVGRAAPAGGAGDEAFAKVALRASEEEEGSQGAETETRRGDEGPEGEREEGSERAEAEGAGKGEEGSGKSQDPPLSQMTVPQKIRLATLGSSFIRATLIRDATKPVAMAAIKAPTVTEAEVKKYAGNTSLHEDVIKYIASRRDWTKLYSVKLSLVQNPKTPVASSMRLLPHLRERDIRFVSRSKGVPSALASQARKLLSQRNRG